MASDSPHVASERKPIKYTPPQVDLKAAATPLPYTDNPLKLVWNDLGLVLKYSWAMPTVLFPLSPLSSDVAQRWDELYPTFDNLFCIGLHTILIFNQLMFLIALPIFLFSPMPLVVFLTGIVIFSITNWGICLIINGLVPVLHSKNGVSVGHYWLQSNLDRLAVTFQRPVTGVHNCTKGIIFDLIECIIQRDFLYGTKAVRDVYQRIKAELVDPEVTKVVFILHSQGGIEGGLVLDWLLADAPREAVQKLEIYTFGNAANHFNNPLNDAVDGKSLMKSLQSGSSDILQTRVLAHIEHFANIYDSVAEFGVINFIKESENWFAGSVFQRDRCGHMMNQHYLNSLFPLKTPYGPVDDAVSSLNTVVDVQTDFAKARERVPSSDVVPSGAMSTSAKMSKVLANKSGMENGPPSTNGAQMNGQTNGVDLITESQQVASIRAQQSEKKYATELSRLWQYRNGMSPPDKLQ